MKTEADLLDDDTWDNPARLSDDDLHAHDLGNSRGPRSSRWAEGCDDWERD